MKDNETVERFIQLRAQNWTFDRIATELKVSMRTLFEWSRKCAPQIQNLRVTESEKRLAQSKISRSDCFEQLDADVRLIREEMAKRNLSEMTAAQLFTLASRLRLESARFNRPAEFAEIITSDHPHEDQFPDPITTWEA